MFTVQSSSWSGSSKLYAVLKRLSRDEGTIATGLKPVELFFSARHRSVAKNRAKELAAAAEPVARIGATSTPADG
jgi:hypothetical protein